MFNSEFNMLLDYYNLCSGKLILLGDMNIHFDQPHFPQPKQILQALCYHSLIQHVSQPTHCLGHTLDWLISRDTENLVLETEISSALPSDHYAVLCSLNLSVPPRKKRLITCRNIRAVDRNKFCDEATLLLSSTSPSDLSLHFDLILRHLLDKYAPTSSRVCPDRALPRGSLLTSLRRSVHVVRPNVVGVLLNLP